MALQNLSLTALEDNCQRETQKYRTGQPHDMRYCLELFRMAIKTESGDALRVIYRLYESLVHHWVRRHPIFSQIDLPAEYIVYDSLSEFYFAINNIIDHFDSIASILTYLRKCVHTNIMQAERKRQRQVLEASWQDLPPAPHDDKADERLTAAEIWQRIESLLGEDDQLLARLVFIQDLKPRQIVALPNSKWQTTNDVRVAVQRIKRHLQKDFELRRMLGVDS